MKYCNHENPSWMLYDNMQNPLCVVCEKCEIQTLRRYDRHKDVRSVATYYNNRVLQRKPFVVPYDSRDQINTLRAWLADAYGVKSAAVWGENKTVLTFNFKKKRYRIINVGGKYVLTDDNNNEIMISYSYATFMGSLGFYLEQEEQNGII